MKADRIAGASLLVMGVGVALTSAAIDTLPDQPTLSARFFPFLLSGVMVIGGLFLLLKPGDRPFAGVLSAVLAPRGLMVAAVFTTYAVTFRIVDFRVGTWLFVLVTMWCLGSRRWWELIVVPIAVSAAVYTTFRYGFLVLLPTWT